MPFKVVIVDDEPWAIIDLMESVDWKGCGFEVISHFENSSNALDVICRINPDVVFTDIRMPKINGLQLIDLAKQNGVTSEFIIISGFADFEFAKQAIKYGVFDYCLKPIDPNTISELLHNLYGKLSQKINPSSVQPAQTPANNTTSQNVNFHKILEYIQLNLHKKIQLDEIAHKFYLNKNYLCYLFKKNLDKTFLNYVTELRVNEAKRLLANPDLTLDDIAKKVGLGDCFYLNKVFKKQEKITPGVYRKLLVQEKKNE